MENLSTFFDIDEANSLKIFAGDIFGVSKDSLKDSYIAQMASLMDFDVFLPGDKDLDKLELLQKYGIKILLSNLKPVQANISINEYLTFNIDDRDIFFLGL